MYVCQGGEGGREGGKGVCVCDCVGAGVIVWVGVGVEGSVWVVQS